MVEGGDVFEVEHILGKCVLWKKIQYLVKCFSYRDKHNVWYNEEDLSEAQEAVKDYEFWFAVHLQTQSTRKKSSQDKDNTSTPHTLYPVPPKPRDSTFSSTQAVASSSSLSLKLLFGLALTPWANRLRPRQ